MRTVVILLLAAPLFAGDIDKDTDKDGLSDFSEKHKYFTDPLKRDSDADGVPDGDWNERREYTYSVRSIVRVMRPVTPKTLNGDYQDVRVLEEAKEYVELEVIHYPLNTVASTIKGNPNWRRDTAHMQAYRNPGPTSNWDEPMRAQLLGMLKRDGIDVDKLDDKQIVEQVSRWLLKHATYTDGFTTFITHFVRGMPMVPPELRDGRDQKQFEQVWSKDLFCRDMFKNKTRGSCTSSAIYLNGCLRAIGIPTRIIYTIPVVDASDPREVEWVRNRITHHKVRTQVYDSVRKLGRSWASHTFNEVFVGGRWHRLNYSNLGQNIMFMGMLTHVATLHDWSDGKAAFTIGLRQGTPRKKDDRFGGGSNPYSCLALSDRFGKHARIRNEVVKRQDLTKLTIETLYWYRDGTVTMRLDDPKTAGHLLMHIGEGRAGEGTAQYKPFYDRVGKDFVLRAKGHPEVRARATRGYWADVRRNVKEFYLRVDPDEYKRMKINVAYTLVALNGDKTFLWVVGKNVQITRKPGQLAMRGPKKLILDKLAWSDRPGAPGRIGRLALLARVKEWRNFAQIKRFTNDGDNRFSLESGGQPPIGLSAAIGGITTGTEAWIVLYVTPADLGRLKKGVRYTLSACNRSETHRWLVAQGMTITR